VKAKLLAVFVCLSSVSFTLHMWPLFVSIRDSARRSDHVSKQRWLCASSGGVRSVAGELDILGDFGYLNVGWLGTRQ